MVNVTLPDGSVRQFEAPVTVAQVASSIGAGLAKAALAGKVDGRLVDTCHLIDADAAARHRHRQGRRSARPDPPRRRARDGAGGAGAVSRYPGDDRPGDRGRLLLRLRARRAVHAGRSGRDRKAHGRDRQARPADPARGLGARGRQARVRRAGRDLQGADHRRHDPARRGALASTARATGSISAAARTCRPPASCRARSS